MLAVWLGKKSGIQLITYKELCSFFTVVSRCIFHLWITNLAVMQLKYKMYLKKQKKITLDKIALSDDTF